MRLQLTVSIVCWSVSVGHWWGDPTPEQVSYTTKIRNLIKNAVRQTHVNGLFSSHLPGWGQKTEDCGGSPTGDRYCNQTLPLTELEQHLLICWFPLMERSVFAEAEVIWLTIKSSGNIYGYFIQNRYKPTKFLFINHMQKQVVTVKASISFCAVVELPIVT